MRKMLFITFSVGKANLAERILNAQIRKNYFSIFHITGDAKKTICGVVKKERPRYILFDGMLPEKTVLPVYKQALKTIETLELDTELYLFDQEHKELPGTQFISFRKLKTLVPQLESAS